MIRLHLLTKHAQHISLATASLEKFCVSLLRSGILKAPCKLGVITDGEKGQRG